MEYTTLEKVREHVGEVHEEIDLDMEEVVSGGGTPRPGGQPAMDLSEESSSKTISCHALGKCPNCPRVLPLRALFGHFGRVHSGQLGGESNKFHWSRVSYLCPFCAEDESNDEENVVVYSTHEELGEHVGREHEGCVLIPLGPSARNSMNEDDEEGKAVPASPPVAVRSSQRQRQRQRNAAAAAAANNDELTPTDPTGPSTTQILYNCPSCERKDIHQTGSHRPLCQSPQHSPKLGQSHHSPGRRHLLHLSRMQSQLQSQGRARYPLWNVARWEVGLG